MDEVAELVTMLFEKSEIEPVYEYISYQRAFEEAAGFDPHQVSSDDCFQYALDNHVEIPQGLTAADDVNDWLDWLLTQVVIPVFKGDGFTFLYDYPAAQCALAKIMPNSEQAPVAKRFELFFGEIELANGFYELTDSDEQFSRFRAENQSRKDTGRESARIDENFIAALTHGLPDCSGVAVGLDRLLMLLTAVTHIEQVLSFSWEQA
jgi:lysyl-tRNA synthetase class 2